MATLIINDSSSLCGTCGMDADPDDTYHFTRLASPREGCGRLFTEVGTYLTLPRHLEGVRRMRPDLTFIGHIDPNVDTPIIH